MEDTERSPVVWQVSIYLRFTPTFGNSSVASGDPPRQLTPAHEAAIDHATVASHRSFPAWRTLKYIAEIYYWYVLG